MEPKINIGDIVITKNVRVDNDIKIGDIVAYRKGQSVITHRIVNIEQDENKILRITTKGDNNNTEDSEKILLNNIEGKVIKIIPKIGNITLFFQKKVIIFFIFLMCYIYMTHTDKIKKKKQERHLKRLENERKKYMS